MLPFHSPHPSIVLARGLVTGAAGNDPRISLEDYLTGFRGRKFDVFARASWTASADAFIQGDLTAIKHLSVGTTSKFQQWLLSPVGRAATEVSLMQVDSTSNLEDVATEADFRAVLGTGNSPISLLWNCLVRELRASGQAGRRGIQVTASKLIAAKRPSLVPMTDTYVRSALNLTWGNAWYRYWQALRDEEVVGALRQLRTTAAVDIRARGTTDPSGDDVTQLSLVRVLDIIAWHWRWQQEQSRLAALRLAAYHRTTSDA
jgi:hypothetical protein